MSLADLGRQGSAGLPRGGSSAAMEAGGDGGGRVLTLKNMHALRTLFNIAHKLHPVLGTSWILVLENLNTLDRILNSPRTTTQVLVLPRIFLAQLRTQWLHQNPLHRKLFYNCPSTALYTVSMRRDLQVLNRCIKKVDSALK